MSAKEDASILKIACFVLPSVSGDTEDAYKKAGDLHKSQGGQRGEIACVKIAMILPSI